MQEGKTHGEGRLCMSMDMQTASLGQGTSVESICPSLHFISI